MYSSYPQPSHPVTAVSASPPHNRPLIEVTGEGTVTAAPNRAVIVLGVITESPQLSTAQSGNTAAVTQVINALLALGIPNDHIQTVTYQIEPQYDFKDGSQVFRGYRVTHLLQITLDRIDQTGLVVDTAVRNGANTVSSVQFTIANPGLAYNQALSAAIHQAEGKARTVAATLGVTLFRTPLKVTEETLAGGPPIPFKATLMAEGAAAPTPIQPGVLEIRAAVRVQYTYY